MDVQRILLGRSFAPQRGVDLLLNRYVIGPMSATDGYICVFDLDSGRIIKVPSHGDVQLGITSAVASLLPFSDLSFDLGSASKNFRDLWVGRNINKEAGTSGVYARVGGVLKVIADTGTTFQNTGAGEDNLMTYSVPGATLAADGDSLEFVAAGTVAANTNNKRIRVRFGSGAVTLVFDTESLTMAAAAQDWVLRGRLIRTGATNCIGFGELTLELGSTGVKSFASMELGINHTLANAGTLKVTGEATANADIIQNTFLIHYLPAGA